LDEEVSVAQLSRTIGLILMVIGIGGYVATDMASPTALIPAVFGMVISMLGYYGRHEATRKTAMHLAMGIALVGILGSMSGLMALPALLSGDAVPMPAAAIARSLMAAVLIIYLVAGIRSFRAARQRR